MAAHRSAGECILISGLGPITCLGFGLDDLVLGISEMTVVHAAHEAEARDDARPRLLADFELKEFLPGAPPDLDARSRYALAAAVLALESGAVQPDEVNLDRCGVFLACGLGRLEARPLSQTMAGEKAQRMGAADPLGEEPAWSAGAGLAEQLGLHGPNRSFRGGLLSGAHALAAALEALQAGEADVMLAGGADVPDREAIARLRRHGPPRGPELGQGASFVLLETQDSVERREGFAFCELASAVCHGARGATSAEELAEELGAAAAQAMDQADVWGGDIGVVFVSSGRSFHPEAAEAEQLALSGFSQVPVTTGKHFVGETFAAGFPLECTLAADVLNDGLVPSKLTFEGARGGVEFWVEREPEPMMGDSALVVGCTSQVVAAAVLRAL